MSATGFQRRRREQQKADLAVAEMKKVPEVVSKDEPEDKTPTVALGKVEVAGRPGARTAGGGGGGSASGLRMEHKGFGRYDVLDEDDEVVEERLSKEDAQRRVDEG